MKTDKLTNLLGLYLLAALLSAFILITFVVRPLWANAQQTRAKAAEQNQKIQALEQLEKDTEVLRQNYEEVRDERDKILALLPAKSEEERLLALLSEISQRSGVALSTFAPSGSTTPAGITAQASSVSIYEASVGVSGTYLSVQQFLANIEDGARFVDVQSGSMSAGSQGSLVSARINLKAYYQQAVPEATQ